MKAKQGEGGRDKGAVRERESVLREEIWPRRDRERGKEREREPKGPSSESFFFEEEKEARRGPPWNDESFLLKYFFDGEYRVGIRPAEPRVDLFTYFQSGLRGIEPGPDGGVPSTSLLLVLRVSAFHHAQKSLRVDEFYYVARSLCLIYTFCIRLFFFTFYSIPPPLPPKIETLYPTPRFTNLLSIVER